MKVERKKNLLAETRHGKKKWKLAKAWYVYAGNSKQLGVAGESVASNVIEVFMCRLCREGLLLQWLIRQAEVES